MIQGAQVHFNRIFTVESNVLGPTDTVVYTGDRIDSAFQNKTNTSMNMSNIPFETTYVRIWLMQIHMSQGPTTLLPE